MALWWYECPPLAKNPECHTKKELVSYRNLSTIKETLTTTYSQDHCPNHCIFSMIESSFLDLTSRDLLRDNVLTRFEIGEFVSNLWGSNPPPDCKRSPCKNTSEIVLRIAKNMCQLKVEPPMPKKHVWLENWMEIVNCIARSSILQDINNSW